MAAQPRPLQFDTKDEDGGTKSPKYLGAFKQLGPQVYFYHPLIHKQGDDTTKRESSSPNTNTTGVPEPNLIIICSWMAAASRHIAKYTDTYLAKYPQVPILLVRSSQLNIMLKPEADQLKEIQPAVNAIQSVFGSLSDEPRVLMHLFSNGGSWSARLLSVTYQRAALGLPLPITSLVLDSCPSLPHMHLSHRALTAALPKIYIVQLLGSILVWIFLFLIRTLDKLHVTSNLILSVRRTLNNPKGCFVRGGLPRVYICSDSDAMVPLEDVKSHAEEAEALMRQIGLDDEEAGKRVGFEKFEGSPHVGHLMVDKERYWKIVQKVWEQGMGEQKSSVDARRR